MSIKKKVILDVDTGSDDAIAIMAALLSPDLEVVGICTVSGNKGLEFTTENTLRVIDLVGATVPVYKGAVAPLAARLFPGRRGFMVAQKSAEVDGKKVDYHPPVLDCLPPSHSKAQDKRAAIWLIETLMASDGDITLIPVGPLTNIALALMIEPAIAVKIKEIVLMGGAWEITNTTSAAEFNIWEDPEAAQIVLNCGCKITMVPLDATHTAVTTAKQNDAIRALGTPVAQAVATLTDQRILAYNLMQPLDEPDVSPNHDALAVLAVIDPTVLQNVKLSRVDVDISGGFADGMTIVDHRTFNDRPKNVYFAYSADAAKFNRMLYDILSLAKA